MTDDSPQRQRSRWTSSWTTAAILAAVVLLVAAVVIGAKISDQRAADRRFDQLFCANATTAQQLLTVHGPKTGKLCADLLG